MTHWRSKRAQERRKRFDFDAWLTDVDDRTDPSWFGLADQDRGIDRLVLGLVFGFVVGVLVVFGMMA